MKKFFALILSILLLSSMAFVLSSCKGENCEHQWSEEIVSSEPTCARSGVSHVYCDICGESQRIVVSKLPHSYSSKWSFDSTYHWRAATCEHSDEFVEKAEHIMEDGVCTVCGMAVVSQGLEYKGNLGENTYRVVGIGTTLDANVIVARYYKDCEIVAIDNSAFENVKGLKSVTLQVYITSIGDRAFSNNETLTFVEFTSAVQYLGDNAFDNCPSLTKIIFRGTKAEWDSIEKGADWRGNSKGFIVDCSDKDILYN